MRYLTEWSAKLMRMDMGNRWAFTTLMTVCAIAFNVLLQPLTGGRIPFAIFFPALAAVGLIGGPWASVFSLSILALAAASFWMIPIDRVSGFALAGFVLSGVAVAAIASFARGVLLREEHRASSLEAVRLELDAAHVTAKIVEWHWDMESGRLQISHGADAIFGVSLTNIQDVWPLTVEEDRQVVEAAFRQGLLQSEFNFENRLRLPATQQERWIQTFVIVHRNKALLPTHLTGLSIDITERKNWLGSNID